MPNHPNRVSTPYHVKIYPGTFLGKFRFEIDALRVAQMWSARFECWAEVYDVRRSVKLIGQYDKGVATPEFAANKEKAK